MVKIKLSDYKGKVVVLDFGQLGVVHVFVHTELLNATSGFNKNEVALLAVNQGEAKNDFKF